MLRYCVPIWRALQAANTITKIVLWLSAGGFVTITLFVSQWGTALLVVGSFVLAVTIFSILVYLSLPVSKAIHTPRYLDWYKNPFRRVSFNFDNYLGMSAHEGKEVGIGRFQAKFKINRGNDIAPREAFVRSINRGKKALIRFRTTEGYKESSDVELIPKGESYWIAADFEDLKEPGDKIPVEDFLQSFSGFEFVMEWEGGKFTRTFSRSELDGVVSSFRQYSNPDPPRQIVTNS